MKILVYTCVFGDYDRIYPPIQRDTKLEYVIVTENHALRVPGWRTHVVDASPFSTYKAANLYYRALIHDELLDYDASLYIDGNIRLLGRTIEVFGPFLASKSALGVFPHSERSTVADEVEACISQGKVGDPESLRSEYREYLSDGFLDDQGLVETGVILKNHRSPELDAAMEMWWKLFKRHCSRDQISFPYMKWKTNVPCYLHEYSFRKKNPYFAFYPHLKDPEINSFHTHLMARSHDSLGYKMLLFIWDVISLIGRRIGFCKL